MKAIQPIDILERVLRQVPVWFDEPQLRIRQIAGSKFVELQVIFSNCLLNYMVYCPDIYELNQKLITAFSKPFLEEYNANCRRNYY